MKRDNAAQETRWRWRVAILLNRLPGQCWADLIEWCLPWTSRAEMTRSLRSPVSRRCIDDAAQSGEGRCYCGKVGGAGKPYREVTR